MNINIQKFSEVAKAAKAKTSDKRWQAAIDKAVAGVASGWWIVTELADGVMVTTECGKSYHANGSCGCEAYRHGQPCKHRALARLVELYNETSSTAEEVSRPALIASIKAAWPQKFPHDNLSDALMYRFKVNSLEFLNVDFLTAIRAIL